MSAVGIGIRGIVKALSAEDPVVPVAERLAVGALAAHAGLSGFRFLSLGHWSLPVMR
jgi:hypothetical protein